MAESRMFNLIQQYVDMRDHFTNQALATMFTPGVTVPDNNVHTLPSPKASPARTVRLFSVDDCVGQGGAGYPSDGSVGHGSGN